MTARQAKKVNRVLNWGRPQLPERATIYRRITVLRAWAALRSLPDKWRAAPTKAWGDRFFRAIRRCRKCRKASLTNR